MRPSVERTWRSRTKVIEKKNPSALSIPSPEEKPLHTFSCLPESIATVLAARRNPAVKTPVGNGAKFVAIFTSTGFRNLSTDEYCAAVETLKPDIAVGPADLFHTSTMPAAKKLVRMAQRTEDWADVFLTAKRRDFFKASGISVFAPVLAVPYTVQWEYLRHLADEVVDSLSGLALYDVDVLPDIEDHHKSLNSLPRLSLHIPDTPQAILRQISPGSCKCYACTTHHRAFLHHLLNAKEMLGWTLLQIHNHQVMADFFAGIRATLAKGAAEFEEQSQRFVAAYEAELPQGTGTRPRARGYHFKGEANPSRINPPAWVDYAADGEGVAAKANGAPIAAEGTETPLVPDLGSLELEEKGFAEVAGKR
ncbi:uncharacterized protein N0V96_003553 [Colletotrichum fioriniae]|uniref:uncharacterized protein n=1 Tax=Colletotrichum fioriniae TaxID=710243 RepID=UPI0032D9B0CD|nr:hypothetical protein N0V96_003553 [Colletotrichum fioriniae]